MRIMQEIRKAVLEQRYRISSHANEEMANDFLDSDDVEHILLTGKVNRKFSRDPRGIRYEITGLTTDERKAFVICRFLQSGVLLIITVFLEMGEKR
jgi:hypothetical protein